MHATLPLLKETDFPSINRERLETLQVNLGYRCNQQCLHCHVNANPKRKESMRLETVNEVISVLKASNIKILDVTGGAPELNPHFRHLVIMARQLDVQVIDRCNLTILEEPGHEDLAEFLAAQQVEIIASLPCYLEENVEEQRGKGVYALSIQGLQKLNSLGYGKENSALKLNLVYNPIGPYIAPSQKKLEADYKRELSGRFGISFNKLFTLTNMPIQRFGSTLISKGKFSEYMGVLKQAYSCNNLSNLMCRTLISVDWQGHLYDCDFNQMLKLPLQIPQKTRAHLRDVKTHDFEGNPITIADHCYGCTAGQGSSCGGALT